MASLESIEATQRGMAGDIGEIKALLEKQNGRLRESEVCIARLEVQQDTRTGMLGALSLVLSAIAAGVGALIK
ncbi:MAG: hypothetical protein ACYC5O_00795 [Anaerolineae bacterium]